MKKLLWIISLFISANAMSQSFVCSNKDVERAFSLALKIVDDNTRNGILAAGADYGGEWTRDASINAWNAASLLRPAVAEESLWSVTINKDTIGHQYWDKIIWVVAAYNHYQITGDREFLSKAYNCSVNTMNELEQKAYDKKYQLFTGPSVFNDGIAGYPEPIFEPGNLSSYVLDHKAAAQIRCLSTNAVYYGAYLCLQKMAAELHQNTSVVNTYQQKASKLKAAILKTFYDPVKNKLNYLVDQNGVVDKSQEGLGISFAVLFGIIDGSKAKELIKNAHVSMFGITSIFPDFKRYSAEQPGRHNNIVWPMVNGFFAQAAIQTGNNRVFTRELIGFTEMALRGTPDFKEIYNPYSGKPDGGWQGNGTIPDHHWNSCKAQTWSATAYLSMALKGLMGMEVNAAGLAFKPMLPQSFDHMELKNLAYREAVLNIRIRGSGSVIKSFTVDGKPVKKPFIKANITGAHDVVIEMIN